MANEIKINLRVEIANGDYKQTFSPSQIRLDQNAQGAHGGIVSVGTSEETFSTGDVSTEGLLILHNLDSANFVTYGQDVSGTMQPIGRLNAGEVHLLRLEPGETLAWIADTAAVKVWTLLLED